VTTGALFPALASWLGRCASIAGASGRSAAAPAVLTLPPKQRACVLLKDIFDYSLEDIAGLVDSTVGGVKAALSVAARNWKHCPHKHSSRARRMWKSHGSCVFTLSDSMNATGTASENSSVLTLACK